MYSGLGSAADACLKGEKNIVRFLWEAEREEKREHTLDLRRRKKQHCKNAACLRAQLDGLGLVDEDAHLATAALAGALVVTALKAEGRLVAVLAAAEGAHGVVGRGEGHDGGDDHQGGGDEAGDLHFGGGCVVVVWGGWWEEEVVV